MRTRLRSRGAAPPPAVMVQPRSPGGPTSRCLGGSLQRPPHAWAVPQNRRAATRRVARSKWIRVPQAEQQREGYERYRKLSTRITRKVPCARKADFVAPPPTHNWASHVRCAVRYLWAEQKADRPRAVHATSGSRWMSFDSRHGDEGCVSRLESKSNTMSRRRRAYHRAPTRLYRLQACISQARQFP